MGTMGNAEFGEREFSPGARRQGFEIELTTTRGREVHDQVGSMSYHKMGDFHARDYPDAPDA